jgi:hypothetical protein
LKRHPVLPEGRWPSTSIVEFLFLPMRWSNLDRGRTPQDLTDSIWKRLMTTGLINDQLNLVPQGQVSLILSCLYVFSLHDFEGIKLVRNHDSFELWPNTSQKASNTKDQTTSIISNWSVGFGCLTAI